MTNEIHVTIEDMANAECEHSISETCMDCKAEAIRQTDGEHAALAAYAIKPVQCRHCGGFSAEGCLKAICALAAEALLNKAELTGKQKERLDYEIAKESLLRTFAETKQVFYIHRKTASNGMSRRLDFYAFTPGRESGELIKLWLSGQFYLVMNAGRRIPEAIENGLLVRGCGFDAAQHVANEISAQLFGETGKIQPERL